MTSPKAARTPSAEAGNPVASDPLLSVSPRHLIDMQRIHAISARASSMVEQIRGRLLAPESRKVAPVFSTAQVAALCGVDKPHVTYRVTKGDLPPGKLTPNGGKREFSLTEARIWARTYRKDKMRPRGQPALCIAVANFKGGVSKTTSAMILAQGLSMRGHRVLAIDIDPTHLVQKPLPPLAYLFLLFVAGRAPGWFLSELAERRQNRIRLFIPKAVDLLTICMSCGMSLEEAFDRVASEIARRAPEVAKEFRMTRYEMLVVNRTVALKRLEARSGVREMKILANSLLQSIQYGTPLTEALQSIAAEARAGQLSELEQKAGRISAVIGVPLIVLVLFPVIALIIAPAAIELARAF